MADIKTRETCSMPKIRDAAAKLPRELIRDVAVRSADPVRSSVLSSAGSRGNQTMTEDAGGRLERGLDRTAGEGSRAVCYGGKNAAQSIVKRIRKTNLETSEESTLPAQNGMRKTVEYPGEFKAFPKTSTLDPGEFPGTDRQTKDPVIREKQTGSIRTSGRDGRGKADRLFHYSADRIKSKGKLDKSGKGTSLANERGHRAYQAGKQLAIRGKQAVGKSAKGAKQMISGIRVMAKTAVTAVRTVAAAISGGVVAVLLVILLGVIGGVAGSSGSSSEQLSQEVLAYSATIRKYASQYGIPDYVASVQAIMMQESGGRGTDPMQASECPYNTRYPNSPGAIRDPEYSIQVGVQYYADCVKQAGCENPADIRRLQLSWQGYNYGNGYIGWALTNYGGYSLENALEFSRQQAAAHGWSGYGDPEYVPHVQRYYPSGNLFAGLFGNRQIVNVALAENGNIGGEKYWRWYGFTSYQEWCACFVSWCGEQAGLIESGTMPRFSLCSDGMTWFRERGKWQAGGSAPTAGTLIFFDWNGDGVPDHVGIVEKNEAGVIHTVEGNCGNQVACNSYNIGDEQILGYGLL